MRLLLDTHAFLWFVLNEPQLSATAQILINDPANDIILTDDQRYLYGGPYRPNPAEKP